VLPGRGASARTRPLVWVFPEYGGQVAVRAGSFKAVRQRLATRQPGAWEVYDLSRDPGETTNLAQRHPEVIAAAVAALQREVADNAVFPVSIPGVNSPEP
jgi:arylsulfatase A-like enzyme